MVIVHHQTWKLPCRFVSCPKSHLLELFKLAYWEYTKLLLPIVPVTPSNQIWILFGFMAFSVLIMLFWLWQLVYQLFTTNVTPGEEDVKIVMQMAEEAVRAQERDPYTAFANRVKELNYGNSYFFKVCLISCFKNY